MSLVDEAILLLGKPGTADALVFASSAKFGSPLADGTLIGVLKRMGRHDLTVHGFRSTFRDWAGEATSHPREVIEMALAHAVENKIEAAYRRGDLFEKRCRLMADWARFCAAPAGRTVTPFRSASAR